jgi:DNA-binding IclR family transcriptional regulator
VRYTVPLGERRPLHATSIGKLFLADWSDAEVRALLRRLRRPRYTRATLVDPDGLLGDLRRVRETGIAIDAEESVDGVVGVAAPIRGPDARLLAGLAVVGSTRVNRKLAETQAAAGRTADRLSGTLAAR